jgi:hypothetical protein
VAAQFVDHRLAENGSFGRVVQNVETDQPGVQIAITHCSSMSETDNEYRSLP